jgi:ribosomal peptide maturation radical SAM protein 1
MKRETILVNMPFWGIRFPSIQLGLLQAVAKEEGIKVQGLYACMDFARRIGFRLYDTIARHRGVLVGEWIFSRAAFPDHPLADQFPERFQHVLSDVAKTARTSEEELLALRNETAVQFISELSDRLTSEDVRIIGFSSTFEQNVASLALARAVKQLNPNIVTIFGGANFDGPMGPAYMRAFPWIDIAVVGEADTAFPAVLRAVLDGEAVPSLPGILTRDRLESAEAIGRATYGGSLDMLPPPDYDSYFDAMERCGFRHEVIGRPLYIPFESSRGCWWGETDHCTFCGLNSLGMPFRAKTQESVLREISYLTQRYRVYRFSAVDNILSLKHLHGLFSHLCDGQYDYTFFWEMKPDLTRENIQLLQGAGVTHVQPGIESLSSRPLKIMNKGTTGIQNINTLRWLQYYGIEALWNILLGFPGETFEDYHQQEQIIRRIHHLPPPHGAVPIWLERFSPYVENSEQYGFSNLRPEPSYAYVYPSDLRLDHAAYFFIADSDKTLSDTAYQSTRQAVAAWKDKWEDRQRRPYLYFLKYHPGIQIYDGRENPSRPEVYFYAKPLSDIYMLCSDGPCAVSSIVDRLSETSGSTIGDEGVQHALERFVESGLMITEDGSYLSLALPKYYRP